MRQAGFVTGIFLIVLCAIATEKSLRLLIFTAKHIHVGSYETLAEACFGIVGFRFIAINMFIMVRLFFLFRWSMDTVLLRDCLRATPLIVTSIFVFFIFFRHTEQ